MYCIFDGKFGGCARSPRLSLSLSSHLSVGISLTRQPFAVKWIPGLRLNQGGKWYSKTPE